MKYAFFGSPRFAAIILGRLIGAGMPPAALVCNPDRPVGRKKIVTPPLTKQAALEANAHGGADGTIAIIQPEKLDEQFIEQLRALAPDFFVVAAYAKIIPRAVLDIPKLGTLGTHPSLLPKYRGASPIQSALLAGEAVTGTTIYAMDEKMDHGAIYAQREWPVAPGTNYPALEEQLAELSAEALIRTIPSFYAGALAPRPQDESQATFTKKFTTQDGFVDEKDLDSATTGGNKEMARAIVNRINALDPEPGCWTMRNGTRIKLLEATLDANGLLKLLVTQEEGQKPKRI
ncbi:MAG: methionyl-tRNA formyltransferase [Chthoniobacter sp.]|nr:methionyl-tRNA formyltransferase [Chthoniobacter sp.]